MRSLTIELDDETFRHLELRAAIDDLRVKEGVEQFLTEIAAAHREHRPVTIVEKGAV